MVTSKGFVSNLYKDKLVDLTIVRLNINQNDFSSEILFVSSFKPKSFNNSLSISFGAFIIKS